MRKYVEGAFATSDYACCRCYAVEHIDGNYYRIPTGEIREYKEVFDTPDEAVEAGRAYLRRVRSRIDEVLEDRNVFGGSDNDDR